MLRAAGHDVDEAEDGPSALAVFNRTPLDVAIVDIGLPGMDGYELARQIRSAPEGPNVALIALTGYGLPDDRKRSGAAGFDRHLVKPVAPEDLRQAMESIQPTRNTSNASSLSKLTGQCIVRTRSRCPVNNHGLPTGAGPRARAQPAGGPARRFPAL